MENTVVKQNIVNRTKAPTLLAMTIAATLSTCSVAETAPLPDSSTQQTQTVSSAYACQPDMMTRADDLRIYQIMVESFVDGDKAVGHGTGYGTSHHHGDLQGIINSLDYIQSLGMNAIWLTPVFESIPMEGQDHWADRLDATGYFASNYFAIDPRFGTLEQAKTLVDQAHAKGMYVFFDGVFGHHKGNVVPSPTGKLPVGESNPVSYPESLPFYQEVATYWIKTLKIDGWRLDQAYQVPPEAWREIRKSVDDASQSVTYQNHEGKQVHPLGYMVAEIWNNENYITQHGYGTNTQPALCSAFDFPVRYRLVETFAVNENGNGGKGGEWLNEGMALHRLYPEHAKPNLMLGNHDLVRFGDLLERGYLATPADEQYWARHKAALSFLAAYTGPITLYYGEEIGDEVADYAAKVYQDCAVQGLCDDHVARSSAKIDGLTATLEQRQQDLKAYVSALMSVRAKHPALSQGKRTNLIATATAYIDHKQADNDKGVNEAVLYAVSTTDAASTVDLPVVGSGSEGVLTDLMSGEQFQPKEGYYHIPLKGFEARFLLIEKPAASGVKVTTQAETSLSGQGFMAQCDNPTVSDAGPMSETLYVVGDFTDSGWKHKDHRQYAYKGNGVYQAVIEEQAGAYRMQYAAKDWTPQFTADGLTLKAGEEGTLKRGGYGKDTAVTLPESGKYVWSLKFSVTGEPETVMVSKCPDAL